MKCPQCGFNLQKDARNLKQNALFHLWMRVMADELGYPSLEDIKRDVKREILGTREVVNRITAEVQYEDYQTSALTMRQMADFMDKVKIWALTELNVYLPYEGDDGYNELIMHHLK